MDVLLEQILRIENGVVACNAKNDLVELALGCFRGVSGLLRGSTGTKGGSYRKICPGEDVGWRAPVDGPFIDDEGYGVEEKANGCSRDGSPA